jgi:division protein CdvB (Snf7/Vps24/ESCRT-III family)
MVKVTGAFQKSTEIMKTTNQLMKLPQLSATMREMSMEMMKVSAVLYTSDLLRVVSWKR